MTQCDVRIYQEPEKMRMICVPDTVRSPWAMVIHLRDTASARFAVMRARRFESVAGGAPARGMGDDDGRDIIGGEGRGFVGYGEGWSPGGGNGAGGGGDGEVIGKVD